MNNDRTALQTEIAALRAEIAQLRQQQAQNEYFRLMVEAAPIGLVIGNLQGHCVESNRAMQAMLGYSEQELRDMPFTVFTHPDDVGVELALFEAVIAGERSQYEVQKRYIRKDGQIIHVHVRASAVRTAAGAVDFFIGVIEDISQRKQTEEQLQRFAKIIEATTDIVGISTMERQVLFLNQAGWRFFQLTSIDHLRIEQLHPPWAMQILVEQALPAVLRDGSWQGETAILAPDGREIPVSQVVIVHHDPTNNTTYLSTIIRDISEQKRAEESLRESQQRLQFALEGSGDGTWDWNIITSEVTFSDRYLAILGYAPGELPGIPDSWATNIHPDDRPFVHQYLQDYMAGRINTYAIEHRLRRKDGGWQWILSRGKIIARDEAGQPLRMTGTLTDIAAQKQAEAERAALQQQIITAQQERLRELSTPLIPISDNVMIMPLIGSIDSQRAQMVLERLLEGVAQHQADLVIIDITGVMVVDTQVAQALIRAAQAVKLLGAQVMLTGIQPQMAQTLVHLGIDLSGIITHGTLQAGIASALGKA